MTPGRVTLCALLQLSWHAYVYFLSLCVVRVAQGLLLWIVLSMPVVYDVCLQGAPGFWISVAIIVYCITLNGIQTLAQPFGSSALSTHVMFGSSRLRLYATDLVYSKNNTYRVSVLHCGPMTQRCYGL